ncbi:MAG: TIR domain-containing protein [Pseudonocardiaceae bacterium]
MTRRIFISYQHRDQLKAKGFNLMRYNKHLDLEFLGRHLLDPLKSDDPGYISRRIRERLKGTSVTVVLIGDVTAQSIWVSREIQWSLEKNPPNGILGIRLSPGAPVPDELTGRGAEILKWYKPEDVHEFRDAIERAAMAARSARLIPTNPASTCSR